MATIKKSEVEKLRRDSEALADAIIDRDYYQNKWWESDERARKFDSEAAMWCKRTVEFMDKTGDLRNKLWAAEQEVHDLKYDLEREKNEHDRATDEWEQIVAGQDKDINDLSNWIIDLLQKPTAVDPPACLKPKDAISYVANLVHYDPISTHTVPQNHTWTVRTFS